MKIIEMLQKNSYIYEEYIFSSHQHTLKGDTYLGGWVGGGWNYPPTDLTYDWKGGEEVKLPS